MNLLLVNISPSKREYIINKCIKNDVAVYKADTTPEVHQALTTVDMTHIFIDIMSKNIDWLEFLKELREAEDGSKYQIIIMSNKTEREFIQSLLYLGIVGFIRSDLNLEQTFERLDKIMKITAKRDKRRKHFRVSIPNKDKVLINFKIPNSDKLITGKVTDISIVAIAFALDKPQDHRELTEGDVIEKVQLKINNKFALATIKIVKANPITVCAFQDLTENALNLLTNYIFISMNNVINADKPEK